MVMMMMTTTTTTTTTMMMMTTTTTTTMMMMTTTTTMTMMTTTTTMMMMTTTTAMMMMTTTTTLSQPTFQSRERESQKYIYEEIVIRFQNLSKKVIKNIANKTLKPGCTSARQVLDLEENCLALVDRFRWEETGERLLVCMALIRPTSPALDWLKSERVTGSVGIALLEKCNTASFKELARFGEGTERTGSLNYEVIMLLLCVIIIFL